MALSLLVSAPQWFPVTPSKAHSLRPLTWSFYCVGYQDLFGQPCRLFEVKGSGGGVVLIYQMELDLLGLTEF